MAFSNFRVNVLLRTLLLASLCWALVWGWLNTNWVMTPIICGALLAISVVNLIRYVERGNRELSSFLTFVASHDFSVPASFPQKGRTFGELQDAYRVLTSELRRLNRQREANHQYLEAVVQHVGTALLCLDDDGNVAMLNQSARRLFRTPHLGNLRAFERIDARLPALLAQLGDGQRTFLDMRSGDDTLQLVLHATRFELLERRYKLVSLQNIRDELEQQEVASWRKLIRVLTHEIMNSVTPIISLSGLLRDSMIESESATSVRPLTHTERSEMLRGIDAIHTRSRGLLDFVQAYRSFATLPVPIPANVPVIALFDRVRTLLSQEMDARRIRLDLHCADAGLLIRADSHQIEQVLINLLHNAAEALSDNPAPRIELRGSRDDQGKVLLQVIDNGTGIAPEHLENIFVPFFSTKTDNSGVGLSISRQIVQANAGFISVRSTPNAGCVFTVKLPAAADQPGGAAHDTADFDVSSTRNTPFVQPKPS